MEERCKDDYIMGEADENGVRLEGLLGGRVNMMCGQLDTAGMLWVKRVRR